MSFNSFRSDLISRLAPDLPGHQLETVLAALDRMASSWEFTPKSTDLIVSDGIPETVRLYIASKSVENLKKGTLYNYLSTLNEFFRMVRKPVDQVTAADARLFLHWFKQEHQISDAYLDHKRVVLKGFFEWCVDEDIICKNPMRHVNPIRCAEPVRLPMTALELETVRDACATLREKALVDFLYSTACRVSELVALNRSDIDLINHTVRILHGKGDKGRVTFINPESEVSLRAYLESRTDSGDALFTSLHSPGRRIGKRTVEKEVTDIVSRCDISVKVTPHVFRHTAASIALQRGMPIDQVQRFLGHARIQTTLRYARTLDFDVRLSHQKYVA